MSEAGVHTREEILSQPQVWAEALQILREKAIDLGSFYRSEKYDRVAFTGCGSTYYLSLAAAASLQELGGPWARGLPASEIWLSPRPFPDGGRTLLVAVSRSGETTETIRACARFLDEMRGDLLTLTCAPGNTLAGMGRLNLVFPFAHEISVAQTRAFSTLYLATVALAMLWTGRQAALSDLERLPEAAKRLLDGCAEQARALGRAEDIERIYYLGSGPRYGLASELSLKMKEMSLSHSEPFHFLEFRHGPQSMANRQTLIVGLLAETSRSQEQAVLDEMRKREARLFSLAEAQADCSFASGMSEAGRNVLCLPAGQVLAFERALSRGLDPDRPHQLEAVVRL
jgi:glutamine---fructose-6-phosphate transaminase (isomerizing)